MSISKNKFSVLGLMSGTSLDGVDIAFCHFIQDALGGWSFEIEDAETYRYDAFWLQRLQSIERCTALEFVQVDRQYGTYLGNLCRAFVNERGVKPDFIASHGHTIFHQPALGYTVQIGFGAAIAAAAHLTVVSDFRSLDVAMGGQGAPLVPIGDMLLFNNYTYCLNLGGFANISYTEQGKRIAFDISPVNMALNYLAGLQGKQYDDRGCSAKAGIFSQSLFDELNALQFYNQSYPKSLGKEWFDKEFLPLISTTSISVEDRLHTVCMHIAHQLALVIQSTQATGSLFITGGGAFNDFLIGCIREKVRVSIVLPDNKTINYKEALIFAFLGVLRTNHDFNCLSSVTGAIKDNVGGAIYYYKS